MNFTTGKKKFVRLSTIQPELNNNQVIIPLNFFKRQSKNNTNNNIIKNINMRRSTTLLNNLGFGLNLIRNTSYDPNNISPTICSMCNNYYNNNDNNKNICNNNYNTKPFNIGTKENRVEFTYSNMKNNNKIYENDKSINKDDINTETNINRFRINCSENNNTDINDNINKSIYPNDSKKSIDKEMMITNSSGKTFTANNTAKNSKSVSFFINNDDSKINNKETVTKQIDKNSFPNIENKIKNKKSHVKLKYNKQFTSINNNKTDKGKTDYNIINNQSDVSIDNISHIKNFKMGSKSPEIMDKDILIHQNNPHESNNNIYSITHSQNQVFKIPSNINIDNLKINSSNGVHMPVKENTNPENDENTDIDVCNLKREGYMQSVFSNNSNYYNNLKIIKDENLCELKVARKETVLYKNSFDLITTDYKKLKSNTKNIEKILNQNNENNRNLRELEINKFAKALEIYNEIYNQQIKIKDIKIKLLANLIDQLIEKENYSILNTLTNCNIIFIIQKFN